MTEEKKPIPMSMNPILNYVNGARILSGEEEFLLALTSGNQIFQFIFSPKHAKRLKLLLDRQLAEYEKKFGVLETKLPEVKTETAEKSKIGF